MLYISQHPTNPLITPQCFNFHPYFSIWVRKTLSPWHFRFGAFPNLGDPYPRTLRSRLWWRQVWNSVHGRDNDGAVGRDDDVVVLGKQGLWYDVNCGHLLTVLSKQHLLVIFFWTLWFLFSSFIFILQQFVSFFFFFDSLTAHLQKQELKLQTEVQ